MAQHPAQQTLAEKSPFWASHTGFDRSGNRKVAELCDCAQRHEMIRPRQHGCAIGNIDFNEPAYSVRTVLNDRATIGRVTHYYFVNGPVQA